MRIARRGVERTARHAADAAGAALRCSARHAASAFAALRADRALHRRQPAEQHALRAQRLPRPALEVEAVVVPHDQPVAERERRVDRVHRRGARSPNTCTSRPSARGPLASSASMSDATTREVLAARAEHPPHRADARGVERREHRVGERRRRARSTRSSPRRRGGRARRRSARSAPRWDAASALRHQSFICCVSAFDSSFAVTSTIGITRS